MPMQEEQSLSINDKERILNQLCVRVKDVMLLTGYGKRQCYRLMKECRTNFNGCAGIRTDAVTTESLCRALGTTKEKELRAISIAKGYVEQWKSYTNVKLLNQKKNGSTIGDLVEVVQVPY